MPIYEYECKHCGRRFEKMQAVTAEPLTECVHCGQGPVRRVIHPAGVIFKGSGWYINDSRKGGSSSTTESSSSSSTSSSESPSTDVSSSTE